MKSVNRYYRRSKISERKFRQIVRYFTMDFTASDVAQLTGLTRKTVTVIFLRIRERVAAECERASPYSDCEVEVDESYFGARRVRGKRGRGASGKTIVFGIFKRNGCVYTEVVPDCRKHTLQGVILQLAADAPTSEVRRFTGGSARLPRNHLYTFVAMGRC